MTSRDYLLDVSRLIWRRWSGRLATGIDRVCLEYSENFAAPSLAVVQYKGRVLVLSPADTDRLIDLLRSTEAGFRRKLIALLARAMARSSRNPPRAGMIYLNVGHTGLDQPGLVSWLARKGARAVYLIHDLIPITHPQYCRPGEAAKHRLRTRNALVSATGLICNSAFTQNSLADFARDIGVGMPRSIVAWISSPPLAVATGPKLLDRPYFVALGTIEGRKNHLLLLKIWDSLATSMGNDAPILVIIGQRGWEAQAAIAILEQPGRLRGHVYELRHCTDHELASWLSGARALLMPSFAEGFGLPVTEAMQLRIPVIASDLPVYREIAGEIPTYLDPLDAVGWEQAIKDFMGDSAERARQLSRLQHYRAPDWRTHFATVEAWLRRL